LLFIKHCLPPDKIKGKKSKQLLFAWFSAGLLQFTFSHCSEGQLNKCSIGLWEVRHKKGELL